MGRGARGKFGIKEVDRGYDQLAKTLKNLATSDAFVKVGVLGSSEERQGDSLDNASLAIVHEFGSPKAGILARSFVRSTFEAKRQEYVQNLRLLVKKVYEGKMDIGRALGIIGVKMSFDMQRKIKAGIPPPNAASTLRRKLGIKGKGDSAVEKLAVTEAKALYNKAGTAKPLIDTGQLVNSITYEVSKGGVNASKVGGVFVKK
jgi:hypothetical protein